MPPTPPQRTTSSTATAAACSWALTTGLYLVGSRSGDEVNLMTANLIVQVCMEPKLVGVALERDSVTNRLVTGVARSRSRCWPGAIVTWCVAS